MKQFFLIICIINSRTLLSKEQLNIISWWDYISNDSLQVMKEGFNINLTVYKSNDVAVAMLIKNKKRFDVGIFSSSTIEALASAGIIEKNDYFRKERSSRSYLSFFLESRYACLPYLWSASLYAHNETERKLKINSIESLLALREKGFRIGVIDDKFEVWARLQLDDESSCYGSKDINEMISCPPTKKKLPLSIKPKDFASAIGDVIKKERSAVYGWHGALLSANKSTSISYSLPKGRQIISYDMLCIIKKEMSKQKKARLVNLISTITSQERMFFNVKHSQYFSPYKGDVGGLTPFFKEIFSDVSKRLLNKKPLILHEPNSQVHKMINKWWTNVRY